MDEFDVVVVGSLNLDLVGNVDRFPGPGETVSGSGFAEHAGGKGLNQAVSAARSGARVAMVGALGADAAGDTLREIVRAEGIDDSLIATIEDVPTGRAMIMVDGSGENSIVVIPGTNGLVTVGDLPPAKVVLAQLEISLHAVGDAFARARTNGAITILNPAPAAALGDDMIGLIDILIPNEHEIDELGGMAEVQRLGVGQLIVTRGSAGVELMTPAGESQHLDPFPVNPIDTTGAGDAFCGALACRLAHGDAMPDALRFAAAAGALATTRHGAVPAQPTRAEVERLLADNPEVRLGE